MKLHIENNLPLRAIQQEFSAYFPNLRLDFYTMPNKAYISPSIRHKLPAYALIGDCRDVQREGELFVSEIEKVKELEQELSLKFGLHAQVSKKEENVWELPGQSFGLMLANEVKHAA
jgi:hypothetical protein